MILLSFLLKVAIVGLIGVGLYIAYLKRSPQGKFSKFEDEQLEGSKENIVETEYNNTDSNLKEV